VFMVSSFQSLVALFSSLSYLLCATIKTEEGFFIALCAFATSQIASSTSSPLERLAKAAPYIEGLRDRLGSVEAVLKNTSSVEGGKGDGGG